MTATLFKDSFGWGFILWLIGYVLGMVLFPFVSVSAIGWVIMPFATLLTLWVAFKNVRGTSLREYLLIALVWTFIAVAFDYVFLLKLLKPADGYYKLDVYLYYVLMFAIPLTVGWYKIRKK